MNLTESKYNFALVREMLETPELIGRFDFTQTEKFIPQIEKMGKIFLTGEVSSRIFPAKHFIDQVRQVGYDLAVATEGSRQAMDYDLSKWSVFAASNSGQTGEIRGDVNGRNFIFDGSQCWGIDFEEKVYGTKEQDAGRLIAFVLTYDPPGTSLKSLLAESLLRHAVNMFAVNPKEVYHWRDLEFQAMRKRRAPRFMET